MRYVSDKRGFTLLEIVIGVTVLGVISASFFAFQHQASKSLGVIADQGTMARVLVSIEKDIMADMIFVPPQDEEAASATTDPNNIKFNESPTFMDANLAGLRCYDRSGAKLPDCANFGTPGTVARFRVRYFSVRVRDRNFPAVSPLSHIPMSRVRFRVESMIDNKIADPMYFSRLKTYAMVY